MQVIKFRTSNYTKDEFIDFINENKIILNGDKSHYKNHLYLLTVNDEFAIYTSVDSHLLTSSNKLIVSSNYEVNIP